jgi:hypothetical protein
MLFNALLVLCCENHLHHVRVLSFGTRQTEYVQLNMVAPSRKFYTSSATLISCYHVTRNEHFYGDLVSPVTMKYTRVLT